MQKSSRKKTHRKTTEYHHINNWFFILFLVDKFFYINSKLFLYIFILFYIWRKTAPNWFHMPWRKYLPISSTKPLISRLRSCCKMDQRENVNMFLLPPWRSSMCIGTKKKAQPSDTRQLWILPRPFKQISMKMNTSVQSRQMRRDSLKSRLTIDLLNKALIKWSWI